VEHHRGSRKYRRVSAHDHTDTHGEHKSAQAVAAPDKDHQDCQEGRHRGIDGTAQGLVDRLVGHLDHIFARVVLDLFPDTVEHDHVVVERITDHRQDSGYERLVYLQ